MVLSILYWGRGDNNLSRRSSFLQYQHDSCQGDKNTHDRDHGRHDSKNKILHHHCKKRLQYPATVANRDVCSGDIRQSAQWQAVVWSEHLFVSLLSAWAALMDTGIIDCCARFCLLFFTGQRQDCRCLCAVLQASTVVFVKIFNLLCR